MLTRLRVIGSVMALCGLAATAQAQPVFFDDFDGPDLLPHWNMFPPPRWEYEVSGGMLHVTDLFSPSTPHTGGNFAVIGAFYEPQMDFRMDVWMGWERTPAPEDDSLSRWSGRSVGSWRNSASEISAAPPQ